MFFGRVDVETPAEDFVLHDYKSNEGWQVIEDFRIPGLNSLESSRSASEGEFDITGRFSWSPGGTGLTGIRAGGRDEPVPALVSSEFLDVADAVVGDTVILSMSSYSLLLRVAAEVEFFPTLDPRDRPFAIVDLPRLIQAETRYSPRPSRGPNELWLSQNAGPGEAQTAESIKDVLREEGIRVRDAFDANAMVEQRVEQPLVNAGWGALLVLLFLAVALASASGLLLFAHMGRQGTTDGVRPPEDPGYFSRADAEDCLGKPASDSVVRSRIGHPAGMAHRLQRSAPDGGGRRRRARRPHPTCSPSTGSGFRRPTLSWLS